MQQETNVSHGNKCYKEKQDKWSRERCVCVVQVVLESLFDKVTFEQTCAGSAGVLQEGSVEEKAFQAEQIASTNAKRQASIWGIEVE